MPNEPTVDAKDAQRFGEWFDVLAVTHRLHAREDLRPRMKAEYFDVLRAYPIEAVQSAYESLRRKMKKWPVPADWLDALPPFASWLRLPALTPEELALNDEAERLGYEAKHVCSCPDCAQVASFLPPRYVPQLDHNQHVIERRHPGRPGRPVLLGRWIHGEELKRWYAARAKFYELKAKIGIELFNEKQRTRSPDERMERLVTETKAVVAETKA